MSSWADQEDLYNRYGDEAIDKIAIRRNWDEDLQQYVADESDEGKEQVIALALEDAKSMILQKLSCTYGGLDQLETLDFPIIKSWHIRLTIETLKRGGMCYGCECIPEMVDCFNCSQLCTEDQTICLSKTNTFISVSCAEFECEKCSSHSCGCKCS